MPPRIATFVVMLTIGSANAQIVATGRSMISGSVESVTKDGLTIRDGDGKSWSVRGQGKGQRGIALADGTLPAALAAIDGGNVPAGVSDVAGSALPDGKQTPDREVTAAVKTAVPKRLVVELPRDKAFNRKTVLSIPLAEGAKARLESDDPARIEPGARVVRVEAIHLQTGELVAESVEVENAEAGTVADTGDEAIERTFRGVSAEAPNRPRLVRSAHFAFMTDVSDREWGVISFKLERMVSALEKFLGSRLGGVVEGFVAREISFEYDQFLATLGNGYRSDLAAWPWRANFHRLADSSETQVKIDAKAGWQASRVLVEVGDRHEIAAIGTWKIAAAGRPLDGDGDADGRGRLVAAVFADFSLSPEIVFGAKAAVVPPATGQLFLRCADEWTELGDNDGELIVTIRRPPSNPAVRSD